MQDEQAFSAFIKQTVRAVSVTDIHTHTFDPAMGKLLLWGIDELLTYHYLVAEVMRCKPDWDYADFFNLSKARQADLVWEELFVKRSPVSEACRGVLTVLNALGLDVSARSLATYREFFNAQNVGDYTNQVLEIAGVDKVYMTNDPLDPQEKAVWDKGFRRDPRFLGVLRLDSAIIDWPVGGALLNQLGYKVDTSLSGLTLSEIRRYFMEWCDRLDARYLAISLPPDFRYPDVESSLTNLIVKTAIPVARERKIPFAMMIGVRKLVNPDLALAGDSVGNSSVETIECLAGDFSDVRFMITMLARENTHALCVAARKFKNILPFGCWWFLNNPSLIAEMTAMRLELLGLSFIPQHSDARVLDQLIYKWLHSRKIIAEVLKNKYFDLKQAGWTASSAEIERDVRLIFSDQWLQSNI